MTKELLVAKVSTPLERVYEVFQEITQGQDHALAWARKIEIVDDSTLREAIAIGKECRRVVKEVEDRRKDLLAPIRSFVEETNQLAKTASADAQEAEGVVDGKIESYNTQKQIEAEREKARIAAEADAARKAQEAEERKRQAEERKRQAEEDARIEAAERAAAEKEEADGAGTAEHAQAVAQAEAEKARIEAERAERERIEAEESARRKKEQDEADAKAAVDMAKAQAAAKTRGVSEVWSFEVIDETKLPRECMSPDNKKIRHLILGGVREIAGVRMWKALNASKR